MLFIPKDFKYSKPFLIKKKGFNFRSNKIVFGSLAFKAKTSGFFKAKHFEMVRRLVSKRIKKLGFFWFRCFPNNIVTKKPAEVRMGKGKGSPSFWVFFIRKGSIFLEFEGLNYREASELLCLCNSKLPFRSKLIQNLK